MPNDRKPYLVWAGTTAFHTDGAPILGTCGASAERVVVMRVETFKRLVAENRDLATAQFNIGEMDE